MKKLLFFHMVYWSIFGYLLARSVWAAPISVPHDHATIPAAIVAVQNDLDPGEGIINSNATFDRYVQMNESVTLSR